MLLLAAFPIAFGLWFLYDGTIAYPRHNRNFAEFQAAKAAGTANTWSEFASTRGWPNKEHAKAYDMDQIRMQWFMAALAGGAGLCALAWLAMCFKRELRSDAEAVYSDTGKRVLISAMRAVDKSRWQSKGIAIAIYEEGGKRRKLTIDDYKYAGGEKILKQIEERLGTTGPE